MDKIQLDCIKDICFTYLIFVYWFQLVYKTKSIRKILLEYSKQMKRTNNNLRLNRWLTKQQNTYDGLPCELLEIKSLKDYSDKCVGYRNKCEFTIGTIIYIILKNHLSKNKFVTIY